MPWLVVVGEREALRWIVKNKRMAFREYINTSEIAARDEMAVYVTRGAFHTPTRDQSQVLALGQFASRPTPRPVTILGESYPTSVGLRLSQVLPEREGMPFKPLVPKMRFIKKKSGWAAYLRRSLVRITDEDMATIKVAFKDFAST